MGLTGEIFTFSAMAPSFETIYEAICEIEGTTVPIEIRRDPSRPLDPAHLDKPGNMLLTADSLSLHRDGKRYLNVHLSLNGRGISISGNDLGLFKSSCIALNKLGGTTRFS
jgi:hypothetical protein